MAKFQQVDLADFLEGVNPESLKIWMLLEQRERKRSGELRKMK